MFLIGLAFLVLIGAAIGTIVAICWWDIRAMLGTTITLAVAYLMAFIAAPLIYEFGADDAIAPGWKYADNVFDFLWYSKGLALIGLTVIACVLCVVAFTKETWLGFTWRKPGTDHAVEEQRGLGWLLLVITSTLAIITLCLLVNDATTKNHFEDLVEQTSGSSKVRGRLSPFSFEMDINAEGEALDNPEVKRWVDLAKAKAKTEKVGSIEISKVHSVKVFSFDNRRIWGYEIVITGKIVGPPEKQFKNAPMRIPAKVSRRKSKEWAENALAMFREIPAGGSFFGGAHLPVIDPPNPFIFPPPK